MAAVSFPHLAITPTRRLYDAGAAVTDRHGQRVGIVCFGFAAQGFW